MGRGRRENGLGFDRMGLGMVIEGIGRLCRADLGVAGKSRSCRLCP